MAGHSRSKNGVASLAYAPAIDVSRLFRFAQALLAGAKKVGCA